MRRYGTTVIVGLLALLASTGCRAPAGLDADLVDDWPALAAPQRFVPAAGVCQRGTQHIGYLGGYQPVDCARPHRAETLHVGTLTGAHARPATPPASGSAARRAAHTECDRAVHRALGGDWRAGRLDLVVVLPSPEAWTGGARWFRCDLSEVRGLDAPGAVPRTGSLRGALTGDGDLRLRCFNPRMADGAVAAMVPVACTARHHAEFVGVWPAEGVSHAQLNRGDERVHQGCLRLIARYTGVPDDRTMRFRAGSIFYHPRERQWRDGNRGVQCFLWLDDRTLTRSLKGAGARGLPLR
ncbi:septum formation family protein [Micromonospora coxensis]|uniref:septum formation family protein n=1 Tax=Micromonospora coxensis TaxID=356852 RepID=UPI003414CAEB